MNKVIHSITLHYLLECAMEFNKEFNNGYFGIDMEIITGGTREYLIKCL